MKVCTTVQNLFFNLFFSSVFSALLRLGRGKYYQTGSHTVISVVLRLPVSTVSVRLLRGHSWSKEEFINSQQMRRLRSSECIHKRYASQKKKCSLQDRRNQFCRSSALLKRLSHSLTLFRFCIFKSACLFFHESKNSSLWQRNKKQGRTATKAFYIPTFTALHSPKLHSFKVRQVLSFWII